jgi:hypothetical protein
MLGKISLIAILFAVVGIASAQPTLELNHLLSTTQTVHINPGGDVYTSPVDATLTIGSVSKDLTVYCVDIKDESRFNVHPAQHVTILDAANLGAKYQEAAELYNYYSPTANTAVKQGGIQVAIWHILFGVSYSGNSAVDTQATSDLAGSFSGASDHAAVYRFDNTSEERDCKTHVNQDMMGGSQAVPEPLSMLALASGALGLLRRRK